MSTGQEIILAFHEVSDEGKTVRLFRKSPEGFEAFQKDCEPMCVNPMVRPRETAVCTKPCGASGKCPAFTNCIMLNDDPSSDTQDMDENAVRITLYETRLESTNEKAPGVSLVARVIGESQEMAEKQLAFLMDNPIPFVTVTDAKIRPRIIQIGLSDLGHKIGGSNTAVFGPNPLNDYPSAKEMIDHLLNSILPPVDPATMN